MRFMRNALLTVIVILVLAATSLWAITYWVKPHTFKIIAQKQLSNLTHQDSVFDGPITWRLLPRPGLHVTNVRIGNPEQTDTVYSLIVDHVLFNIQIKPLFRGQLVFDRLILDGFKLSINPDATPYDLSQKKQLASSQKKHRSHPSMVSIKSLLLTNGQKIVNHNPLDRSVLNHVRLEAWFPQSKHEQVPIQLKAMLTNTSQTLPLQTELSYQGLIRLTPNIKETSTSLINNLELDGQLTLQNIGFKKYEFSKANTHLVFNHKKLQLNPLTLSLYNGESIGQLTYQVDTKQLEFNQTGTTLNAEPVSQTLFGDKLHLKGTLDFSIHALVHLDEPSWLKKSNLNGNLTLRDGTLTYVNLKAITHEATQTIRDLATQNLNIIQETLKHLKPWNINDYSGNTPFELINLQYKTNNDGLLMYNLLLETKKLHLKGQGDLNLETHDVNAHLAANVLTHDPTTQAIQQLLVNGFPLKVNGKIDDLVVHVDSSMIRHLLSNGSLSKPLTQPLKLLQHHLKKLQSDSHDSKEATSE